MEAGGGREIRRALRQAPDYRIDAKRLSAKGVGSYAPLASNDAEPGREKNWRVELVKQ